MDDSFQLAINLRVKRGAHVQSCPQGMLYAQPKSKSEPGISIQYNGHWNPMESYHLVYVDLGKLIQNI